MGSRMNNKEYIYNLSEKMLALQEQIENAQKDNRKIRFKVFGKRTLQVLKAGVALAAVPTLGTSLLLVVGWNPFKINEIEKDTCIVTYIDEEGNKLENQTKEIYTSSLKNTITYYDAWTKLDNETYLRKIYKYKVNEESLLSLIGIIQTNKEMSLDLIEDLIVEKLITDIEISSNVSEEELNKGAHFTATYYSDNENETILVRESDNEHVGGVMLMLVIEMILMAIEGLILYCSTYFFENIKDTFTEKISLENVELLKQQLEKVMEELQESISQGPKKYTKSRLS